MRPNKDIPLLLAGLFRNLDDVRVLLAFAASAHARGYSASRVCIHWALSAAWKQTLLKKYFYSEACWRALGAAEIILQLLEAGTDECAFGYESMPVGHSHQR